MKIKNLKSKKIEIIMAFLGILVAVLLYIDTINDKSINSCFNELIDLRQQYTEKYLQEHQLESYMAYFQMLRTVSIIQNYTDYANEMQKESIGIW